MKTNHAHVEAAILALAIVAIIGLIDLSVDAWDGEPIKKIVYLVIFAITYLACYFFRRKEWSK